MKAKSGEVSHSVRAITVQDMYNLYSICIVEPSAKQRSGAVRYVSSQSTMSILLLIIILNSQAAYLFAFLLMLRIDEVLSLDIGSINFVPSNSKHHFLFSPASADLNNFLRVFL